MKQFYLKTLGVVFLLFLPLATYSSETYSGVYIGGIWYYLDNKSGTASVDKGPSGSVSYKGNIVIPSEVTSYGNTYKVTKISSGAFSGSDITSISIPESVVEIDYYNFYYCSMLEKIVVEEGNPRYTSNPEQNALIDKTQKKLIRGCNNTIIPDYVTEIGSYAFYGCSGLYELTLPDALTTINYYAFYGCSGLNELTLPDALTTIGTDAFYGCSSLEEIIIPQNVRGLKEGTFEGCNSLIKVTLTSMQALSQINYSSDYRKWHNLFCQIFGNQVEQIILGNEITEIVDQAFYGCSNLIDINIPESVTKIGNFAFSGCSQLTNISIPEGVTSIGNNAFGGCSQLTNISIPEGVTRIGNGTFASCSQLTNVIIPDGVMSIGEYAFQNCLSMERINLPNSVSSIGKYAFSLCEKLENIVIPEGVTTIEERCFWGCNNLASITLPKNITSIGGYAFEECTGLNKVVVSDIESFLKMSLSRSANPLYYAHHLYSDNDTEITDLVIPSGITEIGDNTIVNCTNIKSITIPAGVTSIGIISGCTNLTNITIPNSVTKIGGIIGCTSLTNINIPEGVTEFGSFSGCTNLVSINIPKNVTAIDSYAFQGCSNLVSIDIPNSVTAIRNRAFQGCSNLVSIDIPNSVTTINGEAFSGCSSLVSIDIPNSVTNIGHHAFYGCSSLVSIDIPNSVTNIDYNAFSGCSSLVSIGIPNSVTNIDYYAFSGCSSLKKIVVETGNPVYDSRENCNAIIGTKGNGLVLGCKNSTIPNSVTIIESSAFSGCTGLTSIIIPSSVTTIGSSAFYGCTGLTSISIPSSVTTIEESSFSGCTSLERITVESGNTAYDSRNNCNAIIRTDNNALIAACKNTLIPNSVTSIGSYAFSGCTGLTSISIPDGVTSIGVAAFYGCTGLTSISIPSSVTTIGGSAFSGCTGLTSISIPNSVTSIGSEAFYGCTGLTSISIPSSVTTIGSSAFYGCTGLTSVTIPNSVTTIGYEAFNCENLRIVVCENATPPRTDPYTFPKGIMAIVPNNAVDKYREASGWKELNVNNAFTLVETTQTTAKLKVIGISELTKQEIRWNDKVFTPTDSMVVIRGLTPDSLYEIKTSCMYHDLEISGTLSIKTQPMIFKVEKSLSATGGRFRISHSLMEEEVDHEGFEGYPEQAGQSEIYITGLEPSKRQTLYYNIFIKDGEKIAKEISFNTKKLTLFTQEPKVVSPGNIVISATSNLENDEENVGFEWRRTDWTDDFTSNTGEAYLYEGTMEGYIRNLYTEKLWKYRPYYEAKSGTRYYGNWVGIDPTNTSYFEPTVHTYAKISVEGNTAEVRGYVMRGSDNVAEQGFKYWKAVAGVRSAARVMVPRDAMTVEAKGNVMTAELSGLDFETDYCYVAYVTTSEGETFYGEQLQFRTGLNTAGIEGVAMNGKAVEVTRYDMRGQRISEPQRGFNIVRYSDGTTRKVMVK